MAHSYRLARIFTLSNPKLTLYASDSKDSLAYKKKPILNKVINQVTETIQKESLKSKSTSLSCLTDSEKLRTRELQWNQISDPTICNKNDLLASSLTMGDFVSNNNY